MDTKKFFSRAPAKVILTGEHAVVYGAPAIALAVNRFATTEITADIEQGFLFILSDLRTTLRLTLTTLRKVRDRLLEAYRYFIEGKAGIRDVVKAPSDLFQYALLSLIEACQITPLHGLNIKISSTIPIGCGMGSSAATIVSFVKAILHFFHIDKGIEWVEKLILEVESFQHGRASGVDSFISLHGGCVRFCKDQKPVKLPLPLQPMWVIVTGTPESSTGECVSFVSEKWGRDQALWRDFEEVAKVFEKELQRNDTKALSSVMQENHRLLQTIGVVPDKVSRFIQEVELQGGAAKISGAGSIRGSTGGIVIAIASQEIEELSKRYGYQAFPLEGEVKGAEVYA